MPAGLPELRDIHLPGEPSWWPPAPGWWFLFAFVCIAIFIAFRWLHRGMRRRRRHARILGELAHIHSEYARNGDASAFAAKLSAFLRRLSRLVQWQSQALSGDDWIRFLDRHRDGFGEMAGALVDAPFRASVEFDADALHAKVLAHTRRVLETELIDV